MITDLDGQPYSELMRIEEGCALLTEVTRKGGQDA